MLDKLRSSVRASGPRRLFGRLHFDFHHHPTPKPKPDANSANSAPMLSLEQLTGVFAKMPVEIVHHVMSFLSSEELACVAQVNSLFQVEAEAVLYADVEVHTERAAEKFWAATTATTMTIVDSSCQVTGDDWSRVKRQEAMIKQRVHLLRRLVIWECCRYCPTADPKCRLFTELFHLRFPNLTSFACMDGGRLYGRQRTEPPAGPTLSGVARLQSLELYYRDYSYDAGPPPDLEQFIVNQSPTLRRIRLALQETLRQDFRAILPNLEEVSCLVTLLPILVPGRPVHKVEILRLRSEQFGATPFESYQDLTRRTGNKCGGLFELGGQTELTFLRNVIVPTLSQSTSPIRSLKIGVVFSSPEFFSTIASSFPQLVELVIEAFYVAPHVNQSFPQPAEDQDRLQPNWEEKEYLEYHLPIEWPSLHGVAKHDYSSVYHDYLSEEAWSKLLEPVEKLASLRSFEYSYFRWHRQYIAEVFWREGGLGSPPWNMLLTPQLNVVVLGKRVFSKGEGGSWTERFEERSKNHINPRTVDDASFPSSLSDLTLEGQRRRGPLREHYCGHASFPRGPLNYDGNNHQDIIDFFDNM